MPAGPASQERTGLSGCVLFSDPNSPWFLRPSFLLLWAWQGNPKLRGILANRFSAILFEDSSIQHQKWTNSWAFFKKKQTNKKTMCMLKRQSSTSTSYFPGQSCPTVHVSCALTHLLLFSFLLSLPPLPLFLFSPSGRMLSFNISQSKQLIWRRRKSPPLILAQSQCESKAEATCTLRVGLGIHECGQG